MTQGQNIATSPSMHRIALAFGALRRGEMVMIRTADNRAAVMRAAEFADYDTGQMQLVADSAPLLCVRRPLLETMGRQLPSQRQVASTLAGPLGAERILKITFGQETELSSDISFMGEGAQSLAQLATTILRQAKLLPTAIIAALTSQDPHHHARLADMYGMPIINAFDSDHHDSKAHWQLFPTTKASLPLAAAPSSQIVMFRSEAGDENHFAIIVGKGDEMASPLVRLHSSCITGDILGSLKCDCGPQLQTALAKMDEAGGGILLYLAQEGRDIGLMNKIRAYALQDGGHDTVVANHKLGFATDERVFIPAAAMLQQLGVVSVTLMTNNPDKVNQLQQFGIEVTKRVPLALPTNPHNEAYLKTKQEKTGHNFEEDDS